MGKVLNTTFKRIGRFLANGNIAWLLIMYVFASMADVLSFKPSKSKTKRTHSTASKPQFRNLL
jgi:hypothetical protein